MDAVFYFHFHEHNHNTPTHSLAFYVNTTEWTVDFMEGFVQGSMAAQYGVHCNVMYKKTNIIGFRSWGIPSNQCQHVMEQWRQTFSQQFSWGVSGVFDVTHVKHDQMFSHVKQAHEQQQAQLLRATLTTHITAPNTVAPSKKI